ncbi:MAG TPA: SpoIID/LytB domain-containing protein [Tepidisphaeraceae bacterium]|nr:SpoIID/LytB domain-containing protein [Tepidisphaeraceae bacterium]
MRKTAALVSVILATLLCFTAGCSQQAAPTPAPKSPQGPIVRVKLLPDQKQITLTASQPPLVRVAAESSPRRLNATPGVPVTLARTDSGWLLDQNAVGPGELTIIPAGDGSVTINGKAYRGRYRFVPTGGGQFDVINDVDIDSYLKSVVPREMFPNWDPQAYKAQAIVARTYALYTARTSGGQHWDLFPDTRSQVYGGLASESAKAVAAVDETAGVVVAHGPPGKEKIFKAYFSACCGGVTQSAWDAFGDAYTIPLSERNVGPVCNMAPRFNWGPIIVKKDELTRRFRAWGASKDRPEKNMLPVQTIRVAASNRYGRPVRFEVVDVKGTRYSWRSEELRWAVNADAQKGTTLNSSFCKIVDEGDSIRFLDGHGHGHGVGMCQWCAQARALSGWPHENIVLWSFPASTLVRAY